MAPRKKNTAKPDTSTKKLAEEEQIDNEEEIDNPSKKQKTNSNASTTKQTKTTANSKPDEEESESSDVSEEEKEVAKKKRGRKPKQEEIKEEYCGVIYECDNINHPNHRFNGVIESVKLTDIYGFGDTIKREDVMIHFFRILYFKTNNDVKY
jgi:hypothetical protein